MSTGNLVVIESPYAGNVERNLLYARACVVDCLERGEHPIASHLLFTQPGILDDNVTSERSRGIEAGLAWLKVANVHAFYVDLGWSSGMQIARAATFGDMRYEERMLGDGWKERQRSRETPAAGTGVRAELVEIGIDDIRVGDFVDDGENGMMVISDHHWVAFEKKERRRGVTFWRSTLVREEG